MVRRAATETLCNMAGEASLLTVSTYLYLHLYRDNRSSVVFYCFFNVQLLRQPENVRLWLGFSEDFHEAAEAADAEGGDGSASSSSSNAADARLGISLAASGTLAGCASDLEVAEAMVKENCRHTLLALLTSGHEGLMHRGLVVLSGMLQAAPAPAAADEAAVPVEDLDNRRQSICQYLRADEGIEEFGNHSIAVTVKALSKYFIQSGNEDLGELSIQLSEYLAE